MIRKYGLDGIGVTLETAWTGENGERTSLRHLADEFNEAVLEAVLRDSDTSSHSVDVPSAYELLCGDTRSSSTRARRRLEREGINVDEPSEDFVTHQAVHTYLTQVRGASLPVADEDAAARKAETIEKLQRRTLAVAESAISSLANADQLDRGDYDVLVDARTVCPRCGTYIPVRKLLDREVRLCDRQRDARR